MIRSLRKLLAFLKRDFISETSYRLAFVLQIGGLLFSLLAFFYMTKMMDPNAAGLNGIPPFDYLLVGGGRILSIADSDAELRSTSDSEVDLEGQRLLPGLIDGHAHVTGGGGESGFKSRVPPVPVSCP